LANHIDTPDGYVFTEQDLQLLTDYHVVTSNAGDIIGEVSMLDPE